LQIFRQAFPFESFGAFAEYAGNRGQGAAAREWFTLANSIEALNIEKRAVALHPVNCFVEEPGIMPANGRGKNDQRFGIDCPWARAFSMAGHAEG